jgi:Bacterial capsule synthesis protein PGA_cap
MLADVQQARQQADIVLVAFRWGISWGYGHILGYQKELGRAAIEAGADLIMGAHPLNVMGMEMYKGKLLCYSMGNFVMDGQKLDHFGSDTIIVKCRVENKRITKYSLIPVQISSVWQPHPSSHEEGVALMKKVESMSAEFGTTFAMENGEIVIGGSKPGTPEARRGFEIEPHRGLPVLVDATFPPPYIFKKLRGITDGRKR